LTLRRAPELRFELDETLSHARSMDQLIDDANAGLPEPDESDESDKADE
jgi:ribosome-binding factor A